MKVLRFTHKYFPGDPGALSSSVGSESLHIPSLLKYKNINRQLRVPERNK